MTDIVYGGYPKQNSDTLFSGCCSNYFIRFAPALVQSAVVNNANRLHIHVINPTPEALMLSEELITLGKQRLSVSFHDEDLGPLTDEQKRVYYSMLRFFIAPKLIHAFSTNLLIIDIDCVVNCDVPFPNFKARFGLYLRDSLPGTVGWEELGTKCAAGAVYYSNAGLQIAVDVVAKMLDYSGNAMSNARWFTDQVALYQTYLKCLETYKGEDWFVQLDNNYIDWNFLSNTYIWTGKGRRKFDNERYVDRYKQHQDSMRDALDKKRMVG